MAQPVQPTGLVVRCDTLELSAFPGLPSRARSNKGANLPNSSPHAPDHHPLSLQRLPAVTWAGKTHDGHAYRVTVTRPTTETVSSLRTWERTYRRRLRPIRLDVAFDFLTDTTADAGALTAWAQAHVVQRFRRRTEVSAWCDDGIGATRYTRPRRWGTRNLAIYRSINAGRPCLHFEVRALSARQVRSTFGVSSLADLDGIGPALWHRLYGDLFYFAGFPDLDRLGRLVRGQGNRKRADLVTLGPGVTYDRDRRAAHLFIRLGRYLEAGGSPDLPPPSVQGLRDALVRHGRGRVAERVIWPVSAPFWALFRYVPSRDA